MARPKTNLFSRPKDNVQFSEGQKSKGILDDFPIRKHIDLQSGKVEKVPTNDNDIANKKYVDDNAGGGVDWTISQAPDVIHADNYTDTNTTYISSDFTHDDLTGFVANEHIDWTSASSNFSTAGTFTITMPDNTEDSFKLQQGANHYICVSTTNGSEKVEIGCGTNSLVIESDLVSTGVNLDVTGNIIVSGTVDGIDIATDVAANTTHRGDNTQAHSDYLLNSEADAGVGLTLSQDNSSADTQFTPQVLYNTDDTPPAASGFPVGTIYIQYTA